MKKIIALVCCFSFLLLAACEKPAPAAPDGTYMANADDGQLAPYFHFSAAEGTWSASGSLAMDFAVHGSFTLKGNEITATTDGGEIVCKLLVQKDGALLLKSVDGQKDNPIPWLAAGTVYRFWEPLWEAVLPADEALARAKEDGIVVTEGMKCTSGKDVWDAFTASVAHKVPDQVLCAAYYPESRAEEEGVTPASLYFSLLYYDGDGFSVQTRASDEKAPESEEQYQFLMHYTGEAPAGALFKTYDYWVLTDDDSLTWEQIERSLYSADSADFIRHCTVYMDTQ